jgi:hypothetical protein
MIYLKFDSEFVNDRFSELWDLNISFELFCSPRNIVRLWIAADDEQLLMVPPPTAAAGGIVWSWTLLWHSLTNAC